MKSNFKFDKETGTMTPLIDPDVKAANTDTRQEEAQPQPSDGKPVFEKEARIEVTQNPIGAMGAKIVQMKRVDKPTPIQLINAAGIPEAYLDSDTLGVVMFREREDYDICQITDERTGKALAYIGGYALQFSFNMAELSTMERIEQCLQGLVKLFRHKIMNQNLAQSIKDD